MFHAGARNLSISLSPSIARKSSGENLPPKGSLSDKNARNMF